MYQQVMKPFQRTGSRLKRLFETIRDEYWRLHTEFEQEGCSLLPTDVFKRSAKAATWTTCFIIFVTIPMIFYYRNFDELDLYKGLLIQFGFSWLLVFILVVVSSLLWTMTLITGRKIGGSDLFQRYIEKRWGERINEIVKDLLIGKNAFEIEKSEMEVYSTEKKTPEAGKSTSDN